MLNKLISGLAVWMGLFSGIATAGSCPASYSLSYTNPITVSIGSTVNIVVTLTGVPNENYEFQLKKKGAFYGDFTPPSGTPGESAKVIALGTAPSVTFTYTPPASFASYPASSRDFEIKVKKKTGGDCDVKLGGGWPVTSVTVNNVCSTPLSMSTVSAQTMLGYLAPGTPTSLTYTPGGTLTTGGSGAITYSTTILTTGASVGTLTLDNTTGGFVFEPASGWYGDYQFILKADSGTCHAEQPVTIVVQNPTTCSAPSLSPSNITVTQDTAYNGTSAASGGIPPYVFTVSSSPAHGSLTGLNASTGEYIYTPTTGYTGADSFALNVASTCGGNPNTTATTNVTVGAAPPAACNAPTVSPMTLIVPYTATTSTLLPTVSGGTPPYLFSLASLTTLHGSVALTNSSTGEVTYTRTAGYVGSDSFTLNVASSCGGHPSVNATANVTMSNNSVTGTIGSGNVAANGAIIIDNTPNPGTPGIVTNMATIVGGKRFGVNNSFNIDAVQVMQRDVNFTPNRLVDEVGVSNTASTDYQNFGTSRQNNYFANGQHLFDLSRLRRAANWMRVPSSITLPDATSSDSANLMSATVPRDYLNSGSNLPTASTDCTSQALRTTGMGTPIGQPVGSCHSAGTYGTITWREFLQNIRDGRTMYGVVRILVPLQVKSAATSENNALNVTSPSNTIYGFCTSTGEWCANAPTGSTDIKGGTVVGGNNAAPAITMPAISATGAQLKVRGSLMFDFVNGTTDSVLGAPGHPIPLANLPFDPRAIYFKVSVPINVNAANDLNADGRLDNIDYINGLTSVINCSGYPCTATLPDTTVIDNTKVPMEVIEAYNFQYGSTFTSNSSLPFTTKWSTRNLPDKYHMLLASGYVDGWFDAFQELGITAGEWKAIGFTVPPSANLASPLTKNDIRSSTFEDLPTYLYTGGLVDMHHHMNISGLIYVPQSSEIEQKFAGISMYINGGLVVRDGFFFEGKPGGITLISSDPQSFSSIKVNPTAIANAGLTKAYSTLHSDGTPDATLTGVGSDNTTNPLIDPANCFGCSGTQTTSRRREWIEIRPR